MTRLSASLTPMAHKQEQEPKKVLFPPEPKAYRKLGKIGRGGSAEVYKAECIPMDSTVVAIKAINLDRSRADFDNLRRETTTMALLSHPNILQSHCSYTEDRRLCVVMPFMSAGSLQSIISCAFPDGLPETCIAIVLRETLNALSYLHNQGHLHRDIKAGNILMDSDGHVKLADFGVSASVYQPIPDQGSSSSSHSQRLMLSDVAGTPYWMAPEVIHSHTGYSFKADIWSFGITALELAHGHPPLSHLPPSKSLLMKITKRFRFSDYEKHDRKDKSNKFSKAFKDMVASCLNQDPSKRPTAGELMKHPFFKNGKGLDFLVKTVLHGLPSVEERFKEAEALHQVNITTGNESEEEEVEADISGGQNVKTRRLSGWNFNEEGFKLDPVYPVEQPSEDFLVKKVRFAGEVIIHDQKDESGESTGLDGSGDSEQLNQSPPPRAEEQAEVEPDGGNASENTAISTGAFDREFVLSILRPLLVSLDDQSEKISQAMILAGGEIARRNELMHENERLRMELENERRRNIESLVELEYLKAQISGAHDEN